MKRKAYSKYKPSGVEWLGDVPEHWDVKRLKNAANYWVSNVDKVPSEYELPVKLCNYTDVYYNDFITSDMELMETTATSEEIQKFHLNIGDVIITKDSEEWSDIANSALVTKTIPNMVCGYHLAMIRPRIGILLGHYLVRLFQSSSINHQFQIAAKGVTRYGLPKSAIGESIIPLPPPKEQQIIADYLDLETGKIDSLVAKKKRVVELLKEKRTALISKAVTKGLDPQVKLKPSKVEWLGDVPEHWEVVPFKKYVKDQIDYRGATPEKTEEGVFLVTAKNIKMGFIDYNCSKEFVDPIEYNEIMRRGKPKIGDILFTTEAPLGNISLVDRTDIALAQRVILFRMKSNYNHQYVLHLMLSSFFQNQLSSLSTGSTAEGIKASKLSQLLFVLPPNNEQKAIAEYIDQETNKIDSLIVKIEIAIEKLNEYRTALISAAVTGKIDVRGAK